MDTVFSKNGVPIRVIEERWFHITETHDDLAGHYDDVLNAVEDPDFVIEGFMKALIGLKKVSRNKF